MAFLCGIGFTMSLFIGLLAFDDPAIQDKIKLGILCGSLIAGLSGFAVLRTREGAEDIPSRRMSSRTSPRNSPLDNAR